MQDTKGTPLMARVHHLTRFGYVALPDLPALYAGCAAFVTSYTIRPLMRSSVMNA